MYKVTLNKKTISFVTQGEIGLPTNHLFDHFTIANIPGDYSTIDFACWMDG